jgi:hypothetical protein
MKRKKTDAGTFFKVPFNGDKVAYARLLNTALFSFFNIDGQGKTNEEIIQLISNASPIFSIYVFNDVFYKSNWEILGHKPLKEDTLINVPFFFTQDLADPKKCWLANTVPGFNKLVTPQECINLEPSMVWSFQLVEQRLKDYFENKPNKIVEYHKVKL